MPPSPQVSWEDLVRKLTWIDRNNIAQVALDLVDESGRPKVNPDAANLEPATALEVDWWARGT